MFSRDNDLERLTKPCHRQSHLARLTKHGKQKEQEISSALYKKIEPLLPTVTPSPKGGRPRLSDELALNGILFVLRTGLPWEELPQELG